MYIYISDGARLFKQPWLICQENKPITSDANQSYVQL